MQLDRHEEQIYSYLLQLVKSESPKQCLAHFRRLFVEIGDYPESEIPIVLQHISEGKSEEQFKYFFNRCCYILINGWSSNAYSRSVICELVELLESSLQVSNHSSFNHRLLSLVRAFTQTDEHHNLQHLSGLIAQKGLPSEFSRFEDGWKSDFSSDSHSNTSGNYSDRPLWNLGYRYSFVNCDHRWPAEERARFEQRQADQQKKFSTELYSYFTQWSQRSRRTEQTVGFSKDARFQPPNPTLLTTAELDSCLLNFTSKTRNVGIYQANAQHFLKSSSVLPNYRLFKDELYQYLVTSLEPKFRQGQFGRSLRDKLRETLHQRDGQRLSKELLLSTSTKLFDFLVIESHQNSQHHTFINLISNNEIHKVVGLLLKLVMLGQQAAKVSLEKRLAVLFNHYKDAVQQDVAWLIRFLDSIYVAFCTNLSEYSSLFLMR